MLLAVDRKMVAVLRKSLVHEQKRSPSTGNRSSMTVDRSLSAVSWAPPGTYRSSAPAHRPGQ